MLINIILSYKSKQKDGFEFLTVDLRSFSGLKSTVNIIFELLYFNIHRGNRMYLNFCALVRGKMSFGSLLGDIHIKKKQCLICNPCVVGCTAESTFECTFWKYREEIFSAQSCLCKFFNCHIETSIVCALALYLSDWKEKVCLEIFFLTKFGIRPQSTPGRLSDINFYKSDRSVPLTQPSAASPTPPLFSNKVMS